MTFSFDPQAALAETRSRTADHATVATPATEARPNRESVASVATMAAPAVDFDAWEERAAIREHDGGQSRRDAEQAVAREQGFDTVVDMMGAARRPGSRTEF